MLFRSESLKAPVDQMVPRGRCFWKKPMQPLDWKTRVIQALRKQGQVPKQWGLVPKEGPGPNATRRIQLAEEPRESVLGFCRRTISDSEAKCKRVPDPIPSAKRLQNQPRRTLKHYASDPSGGHTSAKSATQDTESLCFRPIWGSHGCKISHAGHRSIMLQTHLGVTRLQN